MDNLSCFRLSKWNLVCDKDYYSTIALVLFGKYQNADSSQISYDFVISQAWLDCWATMFSDTFRIPTDASHRSSFTYSLK